MTAEAIAQILLIAWMIALGLLLIRMLMLRLHHTFLLFAASCGIDIVFGVSTLRFGVDSPATVSLGLLGDTMDVFLSPAVALELFGPTGAVAAYPARQLTPLVLTLLAGIGIDLFLVSTPDADSFQAASVLAYIADTVVTLLVISYILRRRRQEEVPVERNTLWLRRLFAVELVAAALRSLVGLFLESAQIEIADVLFFATCLVATSICVFALRKPPEVPISL